MSEKDKEDVLHFQDFYLIHSSNNSNFTPNKLMFDRATSTWISVVEQKYFYVLAREKASSVLCPAKTQRY